MLSQIEREFLIEPSRFNANYRRVLRHRIKSKVQALQRDLPLIMARLPDIIKECNGITEFRNDKISMNRADFNKILVARGRFELPSAGPKPAMLVHYTTGLLYICNCCSRVNFPKLRLNLYFKNRKFLWFLILLNRRIAAY